MIEIEKEVLNILEKKSTRLRAKVWNALTDQFRSGRDPLDILKLINSEEEYFIDIGLYIINEIIIDDQSIIQFIIDRLYMLLEHEEAYIRFKVLIVLSPLLKESDPNKAKELYLKMCRDGDDDIRRTAKKLLDTGNLIE